jgi:hypothetical protein
MQSEDFDKRIRDAADNHHPAYEEKAWSKMEHLLNKHLPVEKDDRRRIIFFLLLFLLVGGSAWLFISKPWQQSSSPVAGISKEAPENTIGKDTKNINDAGNTKDTRNTTDPSAVSGDPGIGSPVATESINSPAAPTNEATSSNPVSTVKTPPATMPKQDLSGTREKLRNNTKNDDLSVMVSPGQKGRKKKTADPKITDDKDQPAEVTILNGRNDVVTRPVDNNTQTREPQNNNLVDQKTPAVNSQAPINLIASGNQKDSLPIAAVKKEDKNEPVTPEKKKAGKKKNENGLSFTVSAGPDISSVGSKMGEVKPVYGFGLSYTLSRFTIRSGFFAVKKVYSAAPKDYKPVTPPNPLYLYQIDANCKVVEIPVTIAWNFVKAKNHNIFGAAGLSSYLMKQEDYDYVYQYPGSPPFSYKWAVKNKNKHIFSVLSLSAGYTRKLGKTFSFSAEPYVKLPLTGIGLGKVKLNSGGILFTVGARLTGKK